MRFKIVFPRLFSDPPSQLFQNLIKIEENIGEGEIMKEPLQSCFIGWRLSLFEEYPHSIRKQHQKNQ